MAGLICYQLRMEEEAEEEGVSSETSRIMGCDLCPLRL